MNTKYLLGVLLLFVFLLNACKNCVECRYTILKGTEIETFCSSTKQDRDDFEARMDSIAENFGSQAFCERTRN